MTDATISRRDRIERVGGISLWRQIADALRRELMAGNWPPEAPMASEAVLARRFGVNRHTVRRALATLAAEGLVRSTQGRGTFAVGERIAYPIGRRTRFSEIVNRQAREPGGKLLASRTEPADERIAGFLGLATGAKLLVLQTLNVADSVPVSLARSWFAAERFAGLARDYRATGSITASLARHGVTDYLRRWTRVTARMAEADECDRLELPPGSSVLVTEALNEDAAGAPVHYSVAAFSGERVELVIDRETGRE